MWCHDNEICELKSDEKMSYNENESDSGFLSGSQHIEINDVRPTNTFDVNVDTDCNAGGTDSGYIDETKENEERGLIQTNTLTEQFGNLSMKVKEVNTDCEKELPLLKKSQVTTGIGNRKEKWETYFQQNDEGDTHLHCACLLGYVDVAAVLIHMAPHSCILDIQNDDAQTALHVAAFGDQPKIIRMLLFTGADASVQDRRGNTALHLACMSGNLQCVKALTEKLNICELKEGYEVYLKPQNCNRVTKKTCSAWQGDSTKFINMSRNNLETRNYDGERCIHLAAQGSFIEILRQLINCGADINAREGKSGRTPLHMAIEQKNENVVNFLLEEGLKFNLNLDICTYAGITAFQFAYMLENQALQKNLEKMGAQNEKPDSDSESSDVELNFDNSYLSVFVN